MVEKYDLPLRALPRPARVRTIPQPRADAAVPGTHECCVCGELIQHGPAREHIVHQRPARVLIDGSRSVLARGAFVLLNDDVVWVAVSSGCQLHWNTIFSVVHFLVLKLLYFIGNFISEMNVKFSRYRNDDIIIGEEITRTCTQLIVLLLAWPLLSVPPVGDGVIGRRRQAAHGRGATVIVHGGTGPVVIVGLHQEPVGVWRQFAQLQEVEAITVASNHAALHQTNQVRNIIKLAQDELIQRQTNNQQFILEKELQKIQIWSYSYTIDLVINRIATMEYSQQWLLVNAWPVS